MYILLTFSNFNNAGNTWFKKSKRILYTLTPPGDRPHKFHYILVSTATETERRICGQGTVTDSDHNLLLDCTRLQRIMKFQKRNANMGSRETKESARYSRRKAWCDRMWKCSGTISRSVF